MYVCVCMCACVYVCVCACALFLNNVMLELPDRVERSSGLDLSVHNVCRV